MYKIINYTDNNISINVRFDEKNHTIWLTQNEIATLFKIDKSVVSRLVKNATTVASHATVQIEGNKEVKRNLKLYNFATIKSISDRSKSTSVYTFINWAKEILDSNSNNQLANISPNQANNLSLITFNDGDLSLDVRVSYDDETVWLTQEDMAILFDSTIPNINMHIKNIYDSNEQDMEATIKKSLIVQIE